MLAAHMYKHESAIIRAHLDGTIADWDEGAEEFFGYSRNEALGQSLDLVVPEEFRERHWAGFNKVIETGVCRMDRATTNVPVQCQDGEIRPFPARFVFLQNAKGGVAGVIGVYAARTGNEVSFGPIETADE